MLSLKLKYEFRFYINNHLVQELFYYATGRSILNTTLIPSVVEDKLIWKKEKVEHYTVKNAYRLCLEEIVDDSYLHQPGQWTVIRKLKGPSKVKKNLNWQICRGCLPIRARLKER